MNERAEAFTELERGVHAALETYSNVHSKTTPDDAALAWHGAFGPDSTQAVDELATLAAVALVLSLLHWRGGGLRLWLSLAFRAKTAHSWPP